MDDISTYLIPGAIVLVGLFVLLVYILCITVREMSKRLAETNNLLLLAWRAKEGDGFAARALVTRAAGLSKADRPEPPQKPEKAKGVAEKKSGVVLTMGSR